MKILSKELLSVILNKTNYCSCDGSVYVENIVHATIDTENLNRLLYNFSDGCINRTSIMYDGEINIHQVANKCKEWAFDYGWIISSCRASNYTDNDGEFESKRFMAECTSLTGLRGKSFESIESEPDAVFEASEWIRKKISK